MMYLTKEDIVLHCITVRHLPLIFIGASENCARYPKKTCISMSMQRRKILAKTNMTCLTGEHRQLILQIFLTSTANGSLIERRLLTHYSLSVKWKMVSRIRYQ